METIFASLGNLIYSQNGHKGFMIKWCLVAPLCKKWSRNRDCDLQRVQEMVEYHHRGGYIPRMIHLADIQGEGLVCYDGNHRREVFNKCSEDADIICVVDVMFDANQNDVYKAFNNINKSVQLPAIFLDNQSPSHQSVKDDILRLVKTYETKYKPLLSPSARCHAPNFNRDTFTDNIFDIYKHFNDTVSVSMIGDRLEQLNRHYADQTLCRPHSSYKPAIIDKCTKTGLWLFLERSVPVEHIDKLLNGNLKIA